MKKQIAIVILLVILVANCFAFTSCSDDGLEYTLSADGTYTVTGVKNMGVTNIVIPTEYKGVLVTRIGDHALSCLNNLESVIIPWSIISIGDGALSQCISLEYVTIPWSVTFIGRGAFANCFALTGVNFEESNGWYVTKTKGATSGISINVFDAYDSAPYITGTYSDYYWYRTN